MKDISLEIKALIEKYGENTMQAIKENHRLDYLYAMTAIRDNLLEWYPFSKDCSILQIGSDYGALTGLYAGKAASVTVLDSHQDNLDVNRLRHTCQTNITYKPGSLLDNDLEKGSFDYVINIGPDAKTDMDNITAAKSLMKKDGRLIMAVCNTFGIKYWAGAKRDQQHLSSDQLKALLTDNGSDGNLLMYYPMPDYKLPSSIYSDAYLPVKGDLTDTIIAYDYPEYKIFDIGEKFDEICSNNRFPEYANSYLAVWSRASLSEDIVFIKYNSTRRKELQIRTVIGEKNGKKYVEKSAVNKEGIPHILSFKDKYEALCSEYKYIHPAAPRINENEAIAEFDFIEGRTIAEELGSSISDGAVPSDAVKNALDKVLSVSEDSVGEFYVTPEFSEVFGEVDGVDKIKDKSYKTSNVDGLFENMLITEDTVYCIDYEWVYSFPIPADYLKYRILHYFYRRYSSIMNYESETGFLSYFDIDADMCALYEELERNFQLYVHGDMQRILLDDYAVTQKDVEKLAKDSNELRWEKEHVEQLKARLDMQDANIRKMQEVKRLTDNHVTNLEAIIGNLRHEIDEMGKTLTYLNKHEALIYKARRKAGQQFNKIYPKGSLKRKKLGYIKRAVFHPLKSYKMYHSEQGKNLIDGDYKIGDIYREHGKLKFKTFDEPMVSIVIPVYNQINYTYACLVSILRYTKDVTYEVIIADDVSTDATAELGNFADGIVIKRNQTNQGFLRNCNQAAKAARGRYIMFLNNDTQVTEGWLSSLVNLIESDDTIGMVGSKLVYPDGRLQEAGGIIWSDGSGWNYGRLDNPDSPEYNYVKDVDYISGAAILLSTALWKQIGGFDERYAPAYCEDSDLAFEVRKAGFRVVYQPLSKVIHFEGISNGTDVSGTGLKRYQVENSKKLKEKWAEEFAKQCENNGNPDPFRARERSMGKEIILVVDHYVPTYDQDAGSKTTFQYLKMFLKKGYVVKFLGDNYMHEEPYSTTLEQMGIEILYGSYQTKIWDWIKEHGKDIAFAYLNRPHIATKYINYIRDNTDMKIIYYGHDLHFLRESREYALTGDAEKKKEAEYWKSIELSLMYRADMSYYPSYIERDEIHAIDPDIKVKDIVAYVYDEFLEDIDTDFTKREGILFVGGFAHPPNADAVLWFAKKVYPLIKTKCDIPFYVVGSKVTDEIKALEQPENGIHIKGFVSDEELSALYASSRIVVVPLRYGAGVKGKVIEALYNGAPIITTSVGAEGIPGAEDTMIIEDNPEKFAEETVLLYNDTEKLKKMCIRTQEYIKDNYSVEAAWNIIRPDFER